MRSPDKVRRDRQVNYTRHRSEILERKKRYYLENRDKIKTSQGRFYDMHPEKKKEQYKRKARERTAKLAELKNKPCMDCGGSFAPCAMDFDHRPGETKVRGLSNLVSGRWEKVLLELKKCDLVCSNCHRVRTWQRLQAKTCASLDQRRSV